MHVVKLFDEVAMMTQLQNDTVALIHATSIINPIKKLVTAYEIINLNLLIEQRFQDIEDPPWDLPALVDLSTIRRELVVYHRSDFLPVKLLDGYSDKMVRLFHHIHVRKKLTKDLLGVSTPRNK